MSSPSVDSAGADAAPAGPISLASRLTVISVASAIFMQQVDSTALSTALPTLARAFHTNPIHLKLCLTSYILALAVFVPASAWAADRFGARRVFVSAMAVFMAGSVMCALSGSLGVLVAARILQGAGGAMMTPVARIIVVGSHPREQLLKAMVWLTTPAMVGPILGPPLSGFILSIADWPWIFYINVPVGLLGMLAVMRFVPNKRQPHPGRFDGVGFGLSAAAISAMMAGAESVGVGLFPLWVQISAWTIAVAAALAYLRHARRREKPILNLKLLKVPTYRANQTGGALVRLTSGAIPFLLPLLLQGGLGWTPLQAGLMTMWGAVGSMGARIGAQHVIRRFGFRAVLIVTALVNSATVATIGWFRPSTPIMVMAGVLAFGGMLRTNHLTSTNALAFADLPDEQISQATSLTAVVQQMAQALGITVGGLMLHVSQTLDLVHAARPLDPRNFILPFAVIGLGSVGAALTYLPLPADVGAHMHGREGARHRR